MGRKRGDSSSSSSSSSSSDSEGGGDRAKDKERERRGDDEDRRESSRSPRRERDERRSRGQGDDGDVEAKESNGAKQDEKPAAKPSLMERTKMLPVGKAGGAYIPPFRLKQLQAQIEDKSSPEYQRMTWEALKKTINGQVNKVTKPNISGTQGLWFSDPCRYNS